MSTRGAVGFRYQKQDYVHYNHSDSYPTGLGKEVLEFIQGSSSEELQEISSRIVLVSEEDKPTIEQIEQIEKNHFINNFSQQDDWYGILRNVQGNLQAYKYGLNFMLDGKNFLLDSLFCEYAYIVNVDNNTLEFYRGFNQQQLKNNGRYASKQDPLNNNNYYGVALVSKYSFEDIREAQDLSIFIEDMKNKADKFYKKQEKYSLKHKGV
jgi:hypothetical protein